MSVRIRPGDEPAWQWSADAGASASDVSVADAAASAIGDLVADEDRVASPSDIHAVFDPDSAASGGGRFRRPQRTGMPTGLPGWRRGVAALLIGSVVLAVLGGLAYRLSVPAQQAQPVQPSLPPPAALAPTESATPTSAAPPPTRADVMAMPWQGAALPVSDTAGPMVFTQDRSTGFTRDPQGAALAAVHISTHIDPLTGPDVFTSTIDEQVVGAEGLVEQTQQLYERAATKQGLSAEAISDGAPVLAPTGDISDWRIRTFRPDAITTVELLVATPQGQQVVYEVPVVWQDDDWRISFQETGEGAGFRVTEPTRTGGFTPFITRGKSHE